MQRYVVGRRQGGEAYDADNDGGTERKRMRHRWGHGGYTWMQYTHHPALKNPDFGARRSSLAHYRPFFVNSLAFTYNFRPLRGRWAVP